MWIATNLYETNEENRRKEGRKQTNSNDMQNMFRLFWSGHWLMGNSVSIIFGIVVSFVGIPYNRAERFFSFRLVIVHNMLGHYNLSLGLDAGIALEIFRLSAAPVNGVGIAVHHAPNEFVAVYHELSLSVVVVRRFGKRLHHWRRGACHFRSNGFSNQHVCPSLKGKRRN